MLIMVPSAPVSTLSFYDRFRARFPVIADVPDRAMREGGSGGEFHLPSLVENDFESTAVEIVPAIGQGLEVARRVFPQGTALTGSGSVFFSLVPPGEEPLANRLIDTMQGVGVTCYLSSII